MIDKLCQELSLATCTDFDHVELGQIYIYAPQADRTLTLLEASEKIESLKVKYDWFDQGDTVIVRRGKL